MTISLRRFRTVDIDAFTDAVLESVREVSPWMPWCHPGYSHEEARRWIDFCEASWHSGTAYEFAIVNEEDRLLGGCGLNELRPENRIANLGYWVRTSATRKGTATAAVKKIAEFAFTQTGLLRLEIIVAAGNFPSLRVAEKSGALREGIAHDRLQLHGKTHDAVVFAILRSRYH
jgi:RimJ/RimL family protein N-acetyltransferase